MPTFKSCFLAKFNISGNLAILPSSLIISHITPDGFNPANFEISTAASVCPALTNTPPSHDINGNTWPGETKSFLFLLWLIATDIVCDRSAADIPVVTPSLASIEIVNAVKSFF